MKLKTLENTPVKNKTILYRSPYDIGVKKVNGKLVIKDDSRIKATLTTLKYLLNHNCKIVILTWVKRPKGINEQLRTIPHAKTLAKLLNHPVQHINDCVGEKRKQQISQMKPKDILMLENVRFYKEEYENNLTFAKRLTKNCDLIVFDGFPQAHRKAASTTGILKHLPSCAGFYFEREVNSLNKLIDNPEHPFTLVIGGVKIIDKISAINNLIHKVDNVLVGGASANAFLKAQGIELSQSLADKEGIKYAKAIINKYPKKTHIPTDLVLGNNLANSIITDHYELYTGGHKPKLDKWWALDIYKQTANEFRNIISKSKTILWVGPMGLFENERFSRGTKTIAQAISQSGKTSIVAGGDTIEALKKYGDPSKITHISLAGGATLEFLAGKKLPVLEMLKQ